MRKIIYRPDHVTQSDDVVKLGESDNIVKKAISEPDDVFILDGGDPQPEQEFEPDDGGPDGEGFEEASPARVRRRRAETDLEQFREMGRMIIEQATAEASRIIEDGHLRAQTEYSLVMERAHIQAADDRETARRQGHAEALRIHSENITNCIKNIEDAICRIESAQAAFITGYENDLKWMAVEIAEKILSDTIDADQTRLLPLVMTAVHSAKTAQWLSVEISDQMLDLLSGIQAELKQAELDDTVAVKLSPAAPDSCIIETPDRFIDASVTRQIENLKDYFASELH